MQYDDRCTRSRVPNDGSTWWDRFDNDMFRLEASILADNLEFDPVLSKCIRKAYSFAGKIASSAKNEHKLTKRIASINVDHCLVIWCEGSNNRGLENYLKKSTVQKIGLKTYRTAESSFYYRMMVIMNQAKMSQEKLRNKCLSLSRQDRVFARMMGDADERAARPEASTGSPSPGWSVRDRASNNQTGSHSEHSRLTKLMSSANRWSQRQLVSKQA